MKVCIKCNTEKELTEFNKHKRSKDGYQYYCKKCDREIVNQWKKENPNAIKNHKLKHKFGISIEQYNEMYTIQNGCCAICNEHQDSFSKALAVDHCHTTGKIRGLLCSKCNVGIGHFNDDVSKVLNAVAYLTNPPYKDKD